MIPAGFRTQTAPRPSPRAEPVKLDVVCNACGKKGRHTVPTAFVTTEDLVREHFPGLTWPSGWDGFFTPNVLVCKGCGVADDYRLGRKTLFDLLARAAGDVLRREEVIVYFMPSLLWDGTIATRATAALQHLRSLAERDPANGEAWRRYGNFASRLELDEDALNAWRRALSDPREFEAGLCIAQEAALLDAWREAAGWAEVALERFVRPDRSADDRAAAAPMIDWLAGVVCDHAPERTMLASWADGTAPSGGRQVRVSSIRLGRVRRSEALATFLRRGDLIHVSFTDHDPAEGGEITQLEELLVHGRVRRVPVADGGSGASGLNRAERRRAERDARKAARSRR